MPIRHYRAIVEGDAETGYSVFFPDVPGCTSGSDTLQEATLNAEEALASHIELMIESGDKIPSPSCLDDLARPIKPDIIEASRLLVRIDIEETAPA
jgi:predicted RNase H-like HicB family nuclease